MSVKNCFFAALCALLAAGTVRAANFEGGYSQASDGSGSAAAEPRQPHAARRPAASAASYSGARDSYSAPSANSGSLASQRAAERFWSEGSAAPKSFATSFAANTRQDGVGAPLPPDPIGPDSSGPLSSGGTDCATGCCDDCCGPSWSPCYNCCGWFGGADYLYLRPSFSEDTAYVRRNVELDEEENLTTTDTVVPRDFGYNSGVRAFLGYRFCDCGGELRFTYWYYDNNSSQVTPRAPTDGSEIFIGQLETVTQIPGQRLLIDNDLRFNLYDIEYAKCVCMPNCNPCCQPWSLKYFVGARIADIQRRDNGLLQNRDDSLAREWRINGDFVGAGPRVGLEGRRLFGEGRFSLFARTNFSLLLGQWDLSETRLTPPNNPSVTENYFDTHTRIIPVGEIEVGGNYQIGRNISVGAGYMFHAWWDLGAFEQIQGNVFLSPIDDSNIMGLDGLFARVEVCF
jgi:hypothetical protein